LWQFTHPCLPSQIAYCREKVFGFVKRHVDCPLGTYNDSHRLDCVNFFHPKVIVPIVVPNNVKDVRMQQLPFGSRNLIPLVSWSGLELKVSIYVDGQKHIEHCPPNFIIQCFAFQKTIGLKWKTRINLYKFISGTHAPCYSSFWVQYHSRSLKHHKHQFCPNDFSHCIGGTTQKIVISRHVVPTIWVIQEGINLIQKDVTTLEKARFSCDRPHRNNTQSLFGSQFSSSSNSHVPVVSCHSLVRLSDASYWPTICGEGETAFYFQINTTHQQLGGWDLISSVHYFPTIDVPPPGYGGIYNIISYDKGYDVTIGNFLRCSHVYFVTMLVGSLGNRGVYVQCKHGYHVL
jgi:hypothetical protein